MERIFKPLAADRQNKLVAKTIKFKLLKGIRVGMDIKCGMASMAMAIPTNCDKTRSVNQGCYPKINLSYTTFDEMIKQAHQH